MNDKELIDLVLDFTRQINELQEKYFPHTQGAGQDVSAAFAEYQAEAEKIYLRCLTKKGRAYYAGISSPPKFAGIDGSSTYTVEQRKNRAAVTACTKAGLLDFQFNLMNESAFDDE